MLGEERCACIPGTASCLEAQYLWQQAQRGDDQARELLKAHVGSVLATSSASQSDQAQGREEVT